MSLRRLAAFPISVLLAAIACTPSVGTKTNPTSVDYAVFDPAASDIPLPNDLALQPTSIAAAQGAQKELLQAFAAAGGFPNDQEVPITISLIHEDLDPSKKVQPRSAPDLDLSTVKLCDGTNAGTCTLIVFENAPSLAPAPDIEYATRSDRGVLSVRRKPESASGSPFGTRRWKPGAQYIAALRGGPSGAKLKDGSPLLPMPAMFFLLQGKNLNDPRNQGLLPGATPSERAQVGAQLEAIREAYAPAFAAVSAVGFPQSDIVTLQTFKIAPAIDHTWVEGDPSAGLMPLPSDFLLDPVTGLVSTQASAAFGPAAPGIAHLDGFSTTAMELAGTSGPVLASTIDKSSVFFFDLSNPAAPVRLKDVTEGAGATYVTEPPQITQDVGGGVFVSTAIGLQPAVPVVDPSTGAVLATLPPLKEKTEYAVVITDKVTDTGHAATGTLPARGPLPLVPSTLGKIVLFQNPLADASGKSLVGGIPDSQAAATEKVRAALKPVLAALPAGHGTVVMAYTFKTQTVTDVSLALAAAPYQNSTGFVPLSQGFATLTPAAAFTKYGIPGGVPGTGASDAIDEVLEVNVPTLDPIDKTTGALDPDETKWTATAIPALVAVPKAANITASCPAPNQAFKCAPLVAFHHGLGGARAAMLTIANSLNERGFVVAAIDAPLHGARAWCASSSQCVCPSGATGCTATCTEFTGAAGQGDPTPPGPPGVCTGGSVPLDAISGQYFVSGNFFRTRDAIREGALDFSALILALARPPPPTLPPLSSPGPVATALGGKGIAVDPAEVYWVGQSLGGINGTMNAAVDPRITRAVLNVPGGTIVDVVTNSLAFTSTVDKILPTDPHDRLIALQVAKWILDPGDPLNYGEHLLGDATHPTLTGPLGAQAGKKILGQWIKCDEVIPNPFSLELFGLIGLPSADSTVTMFNSSATTCSGAALDGFLLDFVDPTRTLQAQSDAADYLVDPASHLPPATRP